MKADLHIHSVRSADGCMTAEQIKALCLSRGITAAAISEHDLSPEWRTDDGFLWIPAIEYSTEYGHLIGLFLQRPVKETDGRTDFVSAAEEIRAAGGLTVLAHPFERTGKSERRQKEIEKLLPYLDGIEVRNGRADYKFPDANTAAADFAASHGIRCITAGSDAHLPAEVGACYTVLPDCNSLSEMKAALLSGAAVKGRDSQRRYVALSQFQKIKRRKLGWKRWCKTALLWCYLTGKDVFCK